MVKNIKYNFTDIALPVKPNLAVSGIYLIGIKNREVYIGSSVNIYHRLKCHISELKKGNHGNAILQNSFNKSGIKSFYVKVIELVESKDLLFERETVWISKIKPYTYLGSHKLLEEAIKIHSNKKIVKSKR